MKKEFLDINLQFDSIKYPLRILRKEEEYFRMAERSIKTCFTKYKNRFENEGSRLQDKEYMTMTALHQSVQNQRNERRVQEINFEIKSLIAEIDEYLNNNRKV